MAEDADHSDYLAAMQGGVVKYVAEDFPAGKASLDCAGKVKEKLVL